MRAASLIACHQCDLLQAEVALPAGGTARCRCCGAVLYRNCSDGLNRTLAYALAAAVLLMLANLFPIASLHVQGQQTEATLFGIVQTLYAQQQLAIAAMVLVTLLLAPIVEIAAICYLLLPQRLGWPLHGVTAIFRLRQAVKPWVLVDVFMLGVLVSLVKLWPIASVMAGIALWAFAGLIVLLAAIATSFDAHTLWAQSGFPQ